MKQKIINVCLLFITLSILGCSTYENQKLVGKTFPSVKGTSLEGKEYNIPGDFQGESTLLLIGYKQKSQFDIDRWFIGLDMKGVVMPTYEVPTIKGMLPKMFSTFIDNGMKKGIPKPIWKGVITIYDDGKSVQQFTGNTNPTNTRVVLLDKEGKIVYFHDKGFSVPNLNELIDIYNDVK